LLYLNVYNKNAYFASVCEISRFINKKIVKYYVAYDLLNIAEGNFAKTVTIGRPNTNRARELLALGK